MTTPHAGGEAAQPRAVLRFKGADGEHAIPIPLPPAQATLPDLLPAAREISGKTTEMALEREHAAGRRISCRAGCGACCRQLVAISAVEAESLARLVAAMPEERAAVIRGRFTAAVKKLEDAGLLDPAEAPGDRVLTVNDANSAVTAFDIIKRRYFSLGIACPFLENESCGIHPERPMVCREYHVTSPAERCARLYDEDVDRVDVPLRMGGILARTMAKVTSGEIFMIPLVLSLEWSAAHGADLAGSHDGRALLGAMVEEMGRPG